MKISATQKIMRIPTVILLVFILISSIMNAGLLVGAVTDTIEEKSGFQGFIDNTKNAYISNGFKFKNTYININGLFAKLTGRTVYNEVATLKNGMLINEKLGGMDTDSAALATSHFSDFIESCGGKFLYVQAPYKLDINNNLLPVGVDNSANTRANNMLAALSKYNIRTLDLRQFMATDATDVEKYFYRTDHHWNTTGGFLAFQKICENINAVFPEKNLSYSFANINKWNIKTYKKWFLGSQGKRVGIFFAGIDDLQIYEPKTNTEISAYIVNHRTFRKGDFAEVNIVNSYLDEPNYFGDNAYCSYIGGDYPLVQNRNSGAECDLKVLVLKDSFTLPVQAFLTTQYREVDVIDPRYFDECELAEYVECTRPDIVVLLINPWSMEGKKYYSHGIESAKKNLTKTQKQIINAELITIEAGERNSARATVAKNLKSNTKYTFKATNVDVISGTADAAMIALYNASSETVITTRVVDIGYYKNTGEYVWSFVTPDSENDDLQLLIYAGIASKTCGNTVIWENVILDEYN